MAAVPAGLSSTRPSADSRLLMENRGGSGRRRYAHKLPHTFASILYVRGEDPPYVMSQLGHTDAGFTLRVYAHVMRRDDGDKERLKALVEGRDWAPLGTSAPNSPSGHRTTTSPEDDESPADAGLSKDGRG